MDPAPAFWVWHRSSGLSEAEVEGLRKSDAGPIYRQIVEFGLKDGEWTPRPLGNAEVAKGTLPVVRLDPGPAVMEAPDGAAMLARWLSHHFGDAIPSSLQLDYDCPVRLLPRYGAFIAELRGQLGLKEISITALPSWIDSPAFPKLGVAVQEMVPMFYDLTADPPADITNGKALPIGGEDAVRWIRRWKACKTPWRAGLPNFERLSLFKRDGTLSGHLRQWNPEAVEDAPLLQPVRGFTGGSAFAVEKSFTFQGTALEEGQTLLWRAPADDDLTELIKGASNAGARSIVWFALPGPGLRTTHSPQHLGSLMRGEIPKPAITVKQGAGGRIVIRNNGTGDLTLKPGQEMHRLVLQAEHAGNFATTDAGGFFRISVPDDSNVSINFSQRLLLQFPRLLVEEEIESAPGLIIRGNDQGLRWTLDGSSPLPLQ